MQYFSFRSFVSGLRRLRPGGSGGGGDAKSDDDDDGAGMIESIAVRYVVANASAVSFPGAWPGTSVFCTAAGIESQSNDDDDSWGRNTTTEYDDVDGTLSWTQLHPSNGSTFFSYWPPYTHGRHLKLIADCTARISYARGGGGSCGGYGPVIGSLGRTLEGREIECLSIGNGRLTAWVQHRQHPGETMAGE